MPKAITIGALTCFLILGAMISGILGRDSEPTAEPGPRTMVANRAAKTDRLNVSALALVTAAVEPAQSPAEIEPLRQTFATRPSDSQKPTTSDPETAAAVTQEPASAATVSAPAKPKVAARPQPQKSYSLLSDAQIAGIKARLKLSASQEYYWPSVETALRNVARKIHANRLSNPRTQGVPIDPESDEVQQLKLAAMPLLFQLREDQKEEVRKLARIIGLEKVAQQI